MKRNILSFSADHYTKQSVFFDPLVLIESMQVVQSELGCDRETAQSGCPKSKVAVNIIWRNLTEHIFP